MKIQLSISTSRDRPRIGPVKLKLDHVSGAFILLAIGCVCATTVFMIELIWYRYQKKINQIQLNVNVGIKMEAMLEILE